MRRSVIEEKPFITFENVTLRILDRLILENTDWEICQHEHWAILGPNGAGKSTLVKALAGEIPVVKGRIIHHDLPHKRQAVACVSFELEQQLIAWEEKQDEFRYFSGNVDSFTSVREVLGSALEENRRSESNIDNIVDLLKIRSLLKRGIRFLSTGEMRKVLIAKAMMSMPRLLILDEPFDGLDHKAKDRFAKIINALADAETQLVLVTHHFEEIIPAITHVLCVKNGRVFLKGPRQQVLTDYHMDLLFDHKRVVHITPGEQKERSTTAGAETSPILIELKDVTVKYGDLLVLDRLSWRMKAGENWAVLGPNGSGKSTLLNLIIGDNLQAYANEIYLFGRRKGSGETVWDIKEKIGIVSSGLQLQYRQRILVEEVILSGFHDSIGLYRSVTKSQQDSVRWWLEILGISEKAGQRFDKLSYGERRMVLIARAMVKSPPVLILDEPCQGLDTANRRMVLKLIDYIGRETQTGILYVTHHKDEIPACISHRLTLKKPYPSRRN